MSTNQLHYFQKLIQDDIFLPKITPTENLFESVDEDIIAEIDRLTGTSTLNLRKNRQKKAKNTKKIINKYNIENATIRRHRHFR